MKIEIHQVSDCIEPEINITYSQMDNFLQRLIEQIQLLSSFFTIDIDGISRKIPLDDIYYFETVDNKTFLYMEKCVYPCSQKLYELEESLSNTPFVRINKSCILNTNTVDSVRIQFGGRLEAALHNGEKVIVSKHYLRLFRQKIEQEASK